MMHKLTTVCLNPTPDIALYHTGPALDHGPLPTVFYFALSGPDSLTLDPYNQPIQFFQGRMVRTFSMDLPAHENGLPAVDALTVWAEDYAKGEDPLNDFFDKAAKAIDFAINERFADPKKIGVMGLSRGGLICAHIAARDERIKTVLSFAPVTKLHNAKEFASIKDNPKVLSLDSMGLSKALCNRRIRFYIGNRDLRVSTRSSVDFALDLVEKGNDLGISSPQIDFIMRPSIGLMGHGTSPETFKHGADWILECLK